MDYREFSNQLNILNHMYGQVAFVDSERIECLSLDDNGEIIWKPVQIEGLPFIPVIVYPKHIINEEDKTLSCVVTQELRAPHMAIPATHREAYVASLGSDSNGEYHIDYSSTPLDEEVVPVRYNNEDYKTFEHVRSILAVSNYITKHKRKIWEFMHMVDDSIGVCDSLKGKAKTK